MHGGGHVWPGGVCGREHAWQGCAWLGVCVVGGMHGRGGHVWWGACMGGGMCGVGVCGRRGACVTGQTPTAAGGTHPTGMHSGPFYIIQYFVNNYSAGQPAWGTWPGSSTPNQQGSTSNQYSTNSPSPYVSPNDGQSDATNRAGGYGAGYPIYGGGYATKYQRILIRIFWN